MNDSKLNKAKTFLVVKSLTFKNAAIRSDGVMYCSFKKRKNILLNIARVSRFVFISNQTKKIPIRFE